jgi:outer membrane protein assembly factor BamA
MAVGGSLDMVSADAALTSRTGDARVDPTYAQAQAFVEVDTRTSPGYTATGGFYRVGLTDYRQTGSGPYTFQRVDAEAQQYIPLLRESWVIALRGLVSTNAVADGHDVPFFLLPDLGARTLRGYAPWRFRDRNRVLLSGEYRWAAGPFVDMALFMDAGTVASRFSRLDLNRLVTTKGIGVSFHTPDATVLRIEAARSAEGTGLLFSFSPSL